MYDLVLADIMAASELDSRYSQAAADYLRTDDFPVELICPITQTLMHDPVLTVQGNVYERAAITEWLQSHATDPVTNAPLTALTLIPCNPIKAEVEAFKAALTKLSPVAAAKLPSATLSEKESQSIREPTQTPTNHLQASTPATALSQPESTALGTSVPQSHEPASPVSFARLSHPLTSCRQAVTAALDCDAQVSSFQSVIGMYLESKQISAEVFANSVLVPGFKGIKGRLTSGCLQSALEYGRSQPSIRKFNHLMHKLEQLSGQVLDSRPEVKLLWTAALSPFRRQLFNDMYTHHRYMFGASANMMHVAGGA